MTREVSLQFILDAPDGDLKSVELIQGSRDLLALNFNEPRVRRDGVPYPALVALVLPAHVVQDHGGELGLKHLHPLAELQSGRFR